METRRIKVLRVAVFIVGIIFAVGLMPLMHFWPAGFAWEPRQYEYEQMIMGIYITLGIFLIIASRDPLENRSLIWFTIWSSYVHATIMLIQALVDPRDYMNLVGDIPALYIIAIVLTFLMPWSGKKQQQKSV